MAFLIAIAAALVFGVLIAAQLGPAMLDPMFFIPFACLSAFFVGQSDTVWKAMLRALGMMAGVLTIALVLINLDPPRDRWPDASTAISAAALAVSSTFLSATALRWMTARSSVNTARWTLRAAMLALYCLYRWMPGEWLALFSGRDPLVPCLVVSLVLGVTGYGLQIKHPKTIT